MTAPRLPSLSLSHGSPMTAIQDSPARRFLAGLADHLPRPDAILIASAHWETAEPAVASAARPETVHDFWGFPAPLYDIRYPAPGAPALADRVAALLVSAGLGRGDLRDPKQGLDHGAWVPLSLAFPAADIPVAQISIQHPKGPRHHLALGQALAPLREEGVLVIGSGSLTHNLRAFFGQPLDSPVEPWVSAFADWVADRLAAGDLAALLNYRAMAPHAVQNHPRDEHLLPLFVALGCGSHADSDADFGGLTITARRLHASYDHGILAMDAYRFD